MPFRFMRLTPVAAIAAGALLAGPLAWAGSTRATEPARPQGTPTTYTVSTTAIGPAQLIGHGQFSPASQTVNSGDTATVAISADAGYRLIGVDSGGCGVTANGNGTWTTDQILADCMITATFTLSPADVVFQADMDPDIKQFDNLDLNLPQTLLGVSINWQTGATCVGASTAPCDSTFHLRPAQSFAVQGRFALVFRYPTNDDALVAGAEPSYGVVTDVVGEDGNSKPLFSGDTVGAEQPFGYPLTIASMAGWLSSQGVDAYVGFRFLNSQTGIINYGYAHMITSGAPDGAPPNYPIVGFPATIESFAYNRRGAAAVVP